MNNTIIVKHVGTIPSTLIFDNGRFYIIRQTTDHRVYVEATKDFINTYFHCLFPSTCSEADILSYTKNCLPTFPEPLEAYKQEIILSALLDLKLSKELLYITLPMRDLISGKKDTQVYIANPNTQTKTYLFVDSFFSTCMSTPGLTMRSIVKNISDAITQSDTKHTSIFTYDDDILTNIHEVYPALKHLPKLTKRILEVLDNEFTHLRWKYIDPLPPRIEEIYAPSNTFSAITGIAEEKYEQEYEQESSTPSADVKTVDVETPGTQEVHDDNVQTTITDMPSEIIETPVSTPSGHHFLRNTSGKLPTWDLVNDPINKMLEHISVTIHNRIENVEEYESQLYKELQNQWHEDNILIVDTEIIFTHKFVHYMYYRNDPVFSILSYNFQDKGADYRFEIMEKLLEMDNKEEKYHEFTSLCYFHEEKKGYVGISADLVDKCLDYVETEAKHGRNISYEQFSMFVDTIPYKEVSQNKYTFIAAMINAMANSYYVSIALHGDKNWYPAFIDKRLIRLSIEYPYHVIPIRDRGIHTEMIYTGKDGEQIIPIPERYVDICTNQPDSRAFLRVNLHALEYMSDKSVRDARLSVLNKSNKNTVKGATDIYVSNAAVINMVVKYECMYYMLMDNNISALRLANRVLAVLIQMCYKDMEHVANDLNIQNQIYDRLISMTVSFWNNYSRRKQLDTVANRVHRALEVG